MHVERCRICASPVRFPICLLIPDSMLGTDSEAVVRAARERHYILWRGSWARIPLSYRRLAMQYLVLTKELAGTDWKLLWSLNLDLESENELASGIRFERCIICDDCEETAIGLKVRAVYALPGRYQDPDRDVLHCASRRDRGIDWQALCGSARAALLRQPKCQGKCMHEHICFGHPMS